MIDIVFSNLCLPKGKKWIEQYNSSSVTTFQFSKRLPRRNSLGKEKKLKFFIQK